MEVVDDNKKICGEKIINCINNAEKEYKRYLQRNKIKESGLKDNDKDFMINILSYRNIFLMSSNQSNKNKKLIEDYLENLENEMKKTEMTRTIINFINKKNMGELEISKLILKFSERLNDIYMAGNFFYNERKIDTTNYRDTEKKDESFFIEEEYYKYILHNYKKNSKSQLGVKVHHLKNDSILDFFYFPGFDYDIQSNFPIYRQKNMHLDKGTHLFFHGLNCEYLKTNDRLNPNVIMTEKSIEIKDYKNISTGKNVSDLINTITEVKGLLADKIQEATEKNIVSSVIIFSIGTSSRKDDNIPLDHYSLLIVDCQSEKIAIIDPSGDNFNENASNFKNIFEDAEISFINKGCEIQEGEHCGSWTMAFTSVIAKNNKYSSFDEIEKRCKSGELPLDAALEISDYWGEIVVPKKYSHQQEYIPANHQEQQNPFYYQEQQNPFYYQEQQYPFYQEQHLFYQQQYPFYYQEQQNPFDYHYQNNYDYDDNYVDYKLPVGRKYIEELSGSEEEKQQKIEEYRDTHDIYEIHNESWEPQDRCIAIHRGEHKFLKPEILIGFIESYLEKNKCGKIITNLCVSRIREKRSAPSTDSLAALYDVYSDRRVNQSSCQFRTIINQTTRSNQQQNSPTY